MKLASLSSLPRYLLLSFFAFFAQPSCAEWEVLDGVQVIPHNYNDGDSFRASYNGREFLFRLYGADCAETDMSFPDRVADQSRDFGVTSNLAVEWGRRAAHRTAEILKSPFRVLTQWQDALGRSKIPRYYAYVLPSGGGDLAAILLNEGLARAKGLSPSPPSGFPRVGTTTEYKKLQTQAETARRGIWGEESGYSSHEVKPSKININKASQFELESLPGIGPVLATRIIGSRPYREESDLLRVAGLGTSRVSQLKLLISF